MTDAATRQITEILDREAIRDCIYRYCRGVDRGDEACLRSSYWPDATDRHGPYSGSAEGFIDWAKKVWKSGPRNIHHATNILIEFQGETRAAVETYFLALQRGTKPDGTTDQVMLSGRYCDLFEKRGKEWRVLARTVVYDWQEPLAAQAGDEASRFGPRQPIGAYFPDDPVYAIGRT